MPDTAAPPPPAVMMQMLSGSWVSQSIYVAAKLGIPDLIAPSPQSVAELARQTATDEVSLGRLLRALVSIGVLQADDTGRIGNSPLSETLRRDVPGSLRAIAIMLGEEHLQAWGNLLHSVRTGEPAFDNLYGKNFFEYVAEHPESSETFNDAMTAFTTQMQHALLAAYDFSGITRLVDVGGGHGLMLAAILQANPHLHGIVFDLPHVVAGAGAVLESHGVSDRCETVGGDFFAEVPAGDAYIMSNIIHDWDDERSIKILDNCRQAMTGDGKVLLVEMVIPDNNEPFAGKWLDLNMLVMTPGGRERTADEYRELLAKAGLSLNRIVPTQGNDSVVEAIPTGRAK